LALLCRELGLRRREACLLDLRLAKLQAARIGRINVTTGTKRGRGRSVDRWVPVSPEAVRAIEAAASVAGKDQRLVPNDQKLGHWLTHVSQHWSNVARPLGLGVNELIVYS
jgi:integrase